MSERARPRKSVVICPSADLAGLLAAARSCRVCETHLPLGSRLDRPEQDALFCDTTEVAIIPMGFCYPERGRGGDRPPRRECADLWLDQLLAHLPNIELTLLIGLHAQRHFLGRRRMGSLTETVKAWREFAPEFLPLPHPCARNTPWFQRNPWFEQYLLPVLEERVAALAAPGVP